MNFNQSLSAANGFCVYFLAQCVLLRQLLSRCNRARVHDNFQWLGRSLSVHRESRLVHGRSYTRSVRSAKFVVSAALFSLAVGCTPGEVPNEPVHTRSLLEDLRFWKPTFGNGD